MLWYICIGLLLIIMTMVTASLKHLPLTAAILYLCFGSLLGPLAVGLIDLKFPTHAKILEHITETAVLISLFTAGLKLRLPLSAGEWRVPLVLATVSMLITIGLITVVGMFLLKLEPGAAVLLGAILAPTDPVLAASVQVLGPQDRDQLRFSLTGEAGLNDGTAFPFILLGLGMLGLRDLGDYGWRWVLFDVVWGIGGGLAIGTLLATCIGSLIVYLRKIHEETQGLDDFLALGLISITYGISLWLNVYGFLAVFAAGLALRRRERRETQYLDLIEDSGEPHTPAVSASAKMAHGVLSFNEQLEHFGEVIVVLVLGAMLTYSDFHMRYIVLAIALFFVIRPIAVLLTVRPSNQHHRHLMAWFGLRGIGSLYYLAYVIGQRIPVALATELTQITLTVVTASIVVHGISAAPLMIRYSRAKKGRAA